MSLNIPRKIHMIGRAKSLEELEFPYSKNVSLWKKVNPDYEYKYINDVDASQEVKQFSPVLYEMYQDIATRQLEDPGLGVFKADIWRYVRMYNEGGIYLDLDTAPAVPLDVMEVVAYERGVELIVPPLSYGTFKMYHNDVSCYICLEFLYENIYNHFDKHIDYHNNAMFAAVAQSKLIKEMLDGIEKTFSKFKADHQEKNMFEFHYPITAIVDASALGRLIIKNKEKVAETFIYANHAHTVKNSAGKEVVNLKNDFIDYTLFNGSITNSQFL